MSLYTQEFLGSQKAPDTIVQAAEDQSDEMTGVVELPESVRGVLGSADQNAVSGKATVQRLTASELGSCRSKATEVVSAVLGGADKAEVVEDTNPAVEKFSSKSANHEIEQMVQEKPAIISGKNAQSIFVISKDFIRAIKVQKNIDLLPSIVKDVEKAFDAVISKTTGEEEEILIRLKATCLKAIRFEQGLQTIELLFKDASGLQDEKNLMIKFYSDESHPMDLQRSMLSPDLAKRNIFVLQNIAKVTKSAKLHKEINSVLNDKASNDINKFLIEILSLPKARTSRQTVLDMATVPLKIEEIRVGNLAYYHRIGNVDKVFIDDQFSLPLHTGSGSLKLYTDADLAQDLTANELAQVVAGKAFPKGEFVYVRVPDAENKIVILKKEGYEYLKKLQQQSNADRSDIMSRLSENFEHLSGVSITGRTKSPVGIADKLGRLCQDSIKPDNVKKLSIADIVDINGVRITCANPEQIGPVISSLQDMGFEFLEMDNKYNTIRKFGAYKVIPLTLRDQKTGNIFELQIATQQSLACFDLYHNVIYKKEAINLPVTPKQEQFVLRAFNLSAVMETWGIHQNQPVDFSVALGDEDINAMVDKTGTIMAKLEKQRVKAKVLDRQAKAGIAHLSRIKLKKIVRT